MQEIRSSNPPVVTGICDPNKSRARHHRNIYNIFDPKGLTFLTLLRLGHSHVNEHRFRHSFQDCLNPLCSCSLGIEET